MTAIALYARKSVERENSISCETQLEYCRAALHPDERGEELLTYVDNGFSGGNLERDAFKRMMRGVESGRIGKIVVYRLDRISRSLADFVGILETLKRQGVAFVSSQEAFDTSTPYGEMIVKLLMVFAEFERKSIIERVTQAYAHRSELGLYMGGRRPYGYDLAETELCGIRTKMLVPNATELAQIRLIYERYAVSGVSLRRLRTGLTEAGILPTSGHWTASKLSTLLRNPIYVRADNAIYEHFASRGCEIVSDISKFDGRHGLQLYGKSKHKTDDLSDLRAVVMGHEGAVDSGVWLACQRKLELNRQLGSSLGNSTSWLGGKLTCGLCGRTLTVTKGGRRSDGTRVRYFSCVGRAKEGSCRGISVVLYAESLEKMASELIAARLAALSCGRRAVTDENAAQINLVKNRLSELCASEQRLVELTLSEALGEDMLRLLSERARALAAEKPVLEARLASLEEAAEVGSALDLAQSWREASYDERRAVAGLLLERIVIAEDGSVEVRWRV